MKKAFSLLLSLTLMATLAACSSGGSSSGSSAAAGRPDGIDPLAPMTQENLPEIKMETTADLTASALATLQATAPGDSSADASQARELVVPRSLILTPEGQLFVSADGNGPEATITYSRNYWLQTDGTPLYSLCYESLHPKKYITNEEGRLILNPHLEERTQHPAYLFPGESSVQIDKITWTVLFYDESYRPTRTVELSGELDPSLPQGFALSLPVAISPDGAKAVFAKKPNGPGNELAVYDLTEEKALFTIPLDSYGQQSFVTTLQFLTDDVIALALRGPDQTAYCLVYDLAAQKELHYGASQNAFALPDGRILLGSYDPQYPSAAYTGTTYQVMVPTDNGWELQDTSLTGGAFFKGEGTEYGYIRTIDRTAGTTYTVLKLSDLSVQWSVTLPDIRTSGPSLLTEDGGTLYFLDGSTLCRIDKK